MWLNLYEGLISSFLGVKMQTPRQIKQTSKRRVNVTSLGAGKARWSGKKTKPETSFKNDEQNKSANSRRVGKISSVCGKIYGNICGTCEFLARGDVEKWLIGRVVSEFANEMVDTGRS